MTRLESLLAQRKLTLTLATLLSVLGVSSWLTMSRQEDPRLPEYWGQVIASFPGADAETVERLVLDPIEEQLAQVQQIAHVDGKAQPELAIVEIELREDTREISEAWDRVREALRDAREDLPDGVSEPTLDDRQQDQESIVLAVTGSADPLVLAEGAERLKDELLAVSSVSKVEMIGDPGEQITIELDDAAARRLGVAPADIVAQLATRSRVLPGGSVEVGGRELRLRPQSEFTSLDEIRATPVTLSGGGVAPLASVAEVRHGPIEPERTRMRVDGERAVGLGVVPRQSINVVDFGRDVRARVERVAPRLAPLTIREIVYQPQQVADRLSGLSRSLGAGALVVAGVLILTMGARLGLVVSSVVPMVALSSLAIYSIGGGVLQQMSIAALVIAIGMLVDNAIVVAENVQWRLDGGERPRQATVGAIRELAVPLAGATATTLAAFVPMLLAESVTADFTRALPIVIMLTLVVSYVWAIFVTPALAELFLRRRVTPGADRVARTGARIGRIAVGRPLTVLGVVGLLVALSMGLAPLVRQEFFPSSDRAQIVVDVKMIEGSHLDATDAVARRLERALASRGDVVAVTAYVGRSAPHFYYNLPRVPWTPHYAQIVADLVSTDALDPVLAFVRDAARRDFPEAEIVPRRLEQGPPVAAPIEVRVYGHEYEGIARAADLLVDELRAIPGTADVRHSLSLGAPMARFEIDDAAAARHRVSRTDVSLALYGRTRGLPVGQFRGGDDPVTIVVRSSEGERLPASRLDTIDVASPGGDPVPLAQVARLVPDWRPSVIAHRDHRRVVSVYAQLAPEVTYSDVTRRLAPRLASLALPEGVEAEIGGAAESSGEANGAMARIAPVAALLLFGILMAEFRSFRRVGIVLTTVPLAATGVVPGLLIGDQPFGFMSLLGVLALAGVVVNNAIVLLEVIEARRGEGATIDEAVVSAVERRVRPIVLTTLTTVVGLMPLALSDSTLWPPLAWTMISGLAASTLLTLLVVPVLYRLLFDPRSVLPDGSTLRGLLARGAAASGVMLALATIGVEASSEPTPIRLTLAEVTSRAIDNPRVAAASNRARAAEQGAVAQRRDAWLPVIEAEASASRRDRDLSLVTPIGSFPFGDRGFENAALTLRQPLLDMTGQRYATPAAKAEAAAAGHLARRSREVAALEAGEAFLDVVALDARAAAIDAYVASLEAKLGDTEARVKEGRALEADALKVRLALDGARLDRTAIDEARSVATWNLGRAIGLDAPVEPAVDAMAPADERASLEEALARANERRAEIVALDERARALDLRARGVRAERLPRLDAYARGSWASGTPYDRNSWVEGGLVVAWRPFASGTISPRAAAVESERAAIEAERAERQRLVEIDVRGAFAELAVARKAVDVSKTGVAQAAETLRVEEERHRAGRVTTNDLLAAEAELRDQRTRHELARIGVVRAHIRLRAATGE